MMMISWKGILWFTVLTKKATITAKNKNLQNILFKNTPQENFILVVLGFKDFYFLTPSTHPVKIGLSKKIDSKQKTIQTFNIDA